jgi:phage terminase Nu1 subunit (DNA packaging protein)
MSQGVPIGSKSDLQSGVAKYLKRAPRTVRDWMDSGVIPADCADVQSAVIAVVEHYSSVAAGHRSIGASGEVLDLTAERAKLAKAQSETAELRNAELRGELIRRDELVATWSSHVLSWKERIRAVPAAATVHVPGFTAAMGRKLAELIDETLVELAHGRYGQARERPRRRSRNGADTPTPAA